MSNDIALWGRGWYFEKIAVDPKNPDQVYVPNVAVNRSSDGGKNWLPLNYPKEINHVYAMRMRTAQEGYLLSKKGQLAVTKDAGATWSLINLPLEGAKIMPTSFDVPLASVNFTDALHGTVIIYLVMPERGWKAFNTADGGKTWDQEAVPGDLGAIYLSRDGKYLTLTSTLDKTISIVKRD